MPKTKTQITANVSTRKRNNHFHSVLVHCPNHQPVSTNRFRPCYHYTKSCGTIQSKKHMEYTNSVEPKPEYRPTSAQEERAAALRRFNRLFVYLPVIIAAVIALAIVGLLFWVTLFQPGESSRETVGGIASAVIILVSLPMTLLCAIPSILFIGVFVQGRNKGMAPIKRVQTIFWRIDSFVLKIQTAVNENTPKVAGVVIKAHAAVAYVRNLLNQLINLLKRS